MVFGPQPVFHGIRNALVTQYYYRCPGL
jgi:hypothetical protein